MVSRKNYYSQAIDILTRDHDPDALLREIAKAEPSALVRAHTILLDPAGLGALDKVLRSSQTRIDAIKSWRAATGVGLKDALDAVDARVVETGHSFHG
jgi:ribosomal protein L7/L12